MITVLDVKPRDAKVSVEDMRKQGLMPAVFYGPKEETTPITIETGAFERVFKTAGETTIITLKGVDGDKETLVRDVQFHPLTDKPLHADFYVLEKGKKITISIPLEFVGQSPAEKAGHILVKALHEVEIEVAANELPQFLEVDISKLENVGDHVTAADIKLPSSAALLANPEEIVASVTAVVEEKVEVPTEGAAPQEGAAPAETPEAKTE